MSYWKHSICFLQCRGKMYWVSVDLVVTSDIPETLYFVADTEATHKCPGCPSRHREGWWVPLPLCLSCNLWLALAIDMGAFFSQPWCPWKLLLKQSFWQPLSQNDQPSTNLHDYSEWGRNNYFVNTNFEGLVFNPDYADW